MSLTDNILGEYGDRGYTIKRVQHIDVKEPVIETPEWMDTSFDYTVRWDPMYEQWTVVPF